MGELDRIDVIYVRWVDFLTLWKDISGSAGLSPGSTS